MDRDLIVQALDDRRVIQLEYAGAKPRVVQPHAILRKADGTEVLEAYQLRGHSEGGAEYGWKNFDLSKINRVELLEERFEARRDFRPVSSQSGQLVAQVRRDEAVQL